MNVKLIRHISEEQALLLDISLLLCSKILIVVKALNIFCQVSMCSEFPLTHAQKVHLPSAPGHYKKMDSESRPVDLIVNELQGLDIDIVNVRFNSPNLSEAELISRLSEMMNRRNNLVDELQKARAAEFRNFIESLNLKDIQIQPFYPVPRRCKLQLHNPESTELVNMHDEAPTNPWKKMLSSFMKKKQDEKKDETKNTLSMLMARQQNIIAEKKAELQNEIKKIAAKTFLSPTDIAQKARFESELTQLEKFEIGKKKTK